jgi:serine/threonine protein kinase
MSPEQAVGGPVDSRTDVWAFGAVLFEMLSGRRAFPGRTIVEILASVLQGTVDLRAAWQPRARRGSSARRSSTRTIRTRWR